MHSCPTVSEMKYFLERGFNHEQESFNVTECNRHQTEKSMTWFQVSSSKGENWGVFEPVLYLQVRQLYLNYSTQVAIEYDDEWCFSFVTGGLAAFKAFLKSEYSEENIDFWVSCEEYKKIKSPSKLSPKAKKIYNEFISVQATKEVGFPSRKPSGS